MPFLSLESVCAFGKCTPSSKNFSGGEEILHAKHLILCGTVSDNKDVKVWEIYGLVLQTSALSSPPHTVTGTICKTSMQPSSFTCTCKCCKHVLAVLLYCNRNRVDAFEKISTTDKKCHWTTLKEVSLQKYKNVEPISSYCCYKPIILPLPVEIYTQRVLERFKLALPESALAKHSRGIVHQHQTNDIEDFIEIPPSSEVVEMLHVCNHSQRSILMEEISLASVDDPLECCRNFYVRNVVIMNNSSVCEETLNNKQKWLDQRRFRVTGSRCYSLYTYKGADWDTKVKSLFFPKPFTNKFVAHGIQFEPIAREMYAKIKDVKVLECGLIVSDTNPWLGYSPDGVVMESHLPVKLIEIKCPWAGQNVTISELLPTCSYLQKLDNGKYTLKKKHQYYGQISLGMAVLNICETDFIIYCSKDNSMYIETVQLDLDFCRHMLLNLKTKYFHNILHRICSFRDV